jgi:hypothetical protein
MQSSNLLRIHNITSFSKLTALGVTNELVASNQSPLSTQGEPHPTPEATLFQGPVGEYLQQPERK